MESAVHKAAFFITRRENFMPPRPTGRFAPSPTGYMHLGNAWSFLLNWLALRSASGHILLRMDDIDPQRSREHYAKAIIEDLEWLDLDWDAWDDPASMGGMCVQSQNLDHYGQAVKSLESSNLVYPCFCTRGELRSLANAPHVGDIGAPYPGTCRDLSQEQRAEKIRGGKAACLRLRCPEGAVKFTDILQGTQCFSPLDFGGDFALKRSDGVFAYQLATVVDDARMGVNLVLRGRDLLSSTPRQLLLYHLLGHKAPAFAHLPLLLDANGERLAKRHASLSLRSLRARGITNRQLIGELAWRAGILPEAEPCLPRDLLPLFKLESLPRQDIICDLTALP